MSKPNFDLSNLSVQPGKKLDVNPKPKIDNQLIQRSRKGYQVDIPDNPIFECSYWNGKLCCSKKIDSEYFTNHLAEFYERDGYIDEGMKQIKADIDCISKTEDRKFPSNVDFNDDGKFDKRIQTILNEYLNEDCNDYFGRIRKTTLKTPLGKNGQLRLISVYTIDTDTGISHLDLLFIDFYHLFIPSKHNGLSAEEAMKINYEKHKKHNKCMHECFK
ncbi:hypothetical protein [Carnobacterium maltaromaticum]|uniref:hypothetical protein n=1 Tax=Carnobacterium maltaromaticum TaxID=2751 RepID=UPI0012F71332|nr:hypothetical protein [Carnobacterium maltaromaticum]